MALAFGAEGYYTRTPAELRQCFEKALMQDQKPVLINVSINPVAQKKPQVNWSLHVAMQIVCVSYVEELLVDKDKIVTCISVSEISVVSLYPFNLNWFTGIYLNSEIHFK